MQQTLSFKTLEKFVGIKIGVINRWSGKVLCQSRERAVEGRIPEDESIFVLGVVREEQREPRLTYLLKIIPIYDTVGKLKIK